MVWSTKAEQMGVISLAYSLSGHTLVSGGVDGRIGLWDAQTGILLEYLYGHQGPVTSLAYSSSGDLLFSGSRQRPPSEVGGLWGNRQATG